MTIKPGYLLNKLFLNQHSKVIYKNPLKTRIISSVPSRSSVSTLSTCSLTSPSPLYNRTSHRSRQSRKFSTLTEATPTLKTSLAAESVPDDDTAYFKKLGKTVNKYWISNAEEVFQRLDWQRLVHPEDKGKSLKENLRRRFCDDKVDVEEIRNIWLKIQACRKGEERQALVEKIVSLALWVPNDTHEDSMAIEDDIPLPLFVHGEPQQGQNVQEFQKYCDKRNWLKNDNLGNLAFHRSYYLKSPLAELEEALVRFSLDSIKRSGFQLISVPDILHPHIIESCGMRTRGERDQVFWLEIPDKKEIEVCLSGTAEMAIGGSFQNRIFEEDELPIKLAAVSRCFRAETSSLDEERGLYRVHDFTKVELFGITANETGKESDTLHDEFRSIEESNFSKLGLHFKTLEMPPGELGLPALRKFDIEAWMPGRKMFGEISSCSNCTDFQSRRLNIRYRPKNSQNLADSKNPDLEFVHTVNGTACAVPRMLIALIETFQQADGSVKLPVVLEQFMTRSWDECVKTHKPVKSMFIRAKSSQEKYTKEFRKMEL